MKEVALTSDDVATNRGLPGRKRQAARNDGVILQAAREVFLADPQAPVSAVAARAGVGISALYRRYPGKEDLLRTLCHEGLRRYVAEAEAALARSTAPDGSTSPDGSTAASAGSGEGPDGWQALVQFLERVVDADVHSLTVHLAGTFTPTPEMADAAERSGELTDRLVDRARRTGRLRADVVAADIGLVQECCAAIRHPDPVRTQQLRRRFLAVLMAGLATDGRTLPGPPPQPGEFAGRWQVR